MNKPIIAGIFLIALITGILLMTMKTGAEDEIKDTWIDDEYVALCEEIGAEYNISPELLVAIIETESSGQQYADNGNCKGLCQIYAGVHIARMQKLGLHDIYNPRTNITLAADILKENFEQYGDDLSLVLMAYNGTSHARQKAEAGQLSDYAVKVSKRAYDLETLHGKHNYTQYLRNPKLLEWRAKDD